MNDELLKKIKENDLTIEEWLKMRVTEEYEKALMNKIDELQSNWNSLRGIIEDYLKEYGYDYNELTMKKDIINVNGLWLKFVLDKMNELESSDKN